MIVPAVDLAAIPDTLTDAAAAALPLAAMTAWQAFADTTRVTMGRRVLITGVGHLALQIAHHLGATVTAVASAAKHGWLRGLGADRTVDYTDPAALAALSAEPVDVALNLVGGDTARQALAAVRPGGVQVATASVHTERAWLEQIAHVAEIKAVVPEVAQVFDRADAAEAHRIVEAGHVQGKVVLRA